MRTKFTKFTFKPTNVVFSYTSSPTPDGFTLGKRRNSFCTYLVENKKVAQDLQAPTHSKSSFLGSGSYGAVNLMAPLSDTALPIAIKQIEPQKYFGRLTKWEIKNWITRWCGKTANEARINYLLNGVGASFCSQDSFSIVDEHGKKKLSSYPIVYIAMSQASGSQIYKHTFKSLLEYLEVCIATIKALQVIHAKNVVHADIHVKNILLEEEKGEFRIRFVDHTLSCMVGERIEDLRTLNMDIKPPEYRDRDFIEAKFNQDVWCLGYVFKHLGTSYLNPFFISAPGNIQDNILNFIDKMMHPDPDRRCNLNDALHFFANRYLELTIPTSLNRIHNLFASSIIKNETKDQEALLTAFDQGAIYLALNDKVLFTELDKTPISFQKLFINLILNLPERAIVMVLPKLIKDKLRKTIRFCIHSLPNEQKKLAYLFLLKLKSDELEHSMTELHAIDKWCYCHAHIFQINDSFDARLEEVAYQKLKGDLGDPTYGAKRLDGFIETTEKVLSFLKQAPEKMRLSLLKHLSNVDKSFYIQNMSLNFDIFCQLLLPEDRTEFALFLFGEPELKQEGIDVIFGHFGKDIWKSVKEREFQLVDDEITNKRFFEFLFKFALSASTNEIIKEEVFQYLLHQLKEFGQKFDSEDGINRWFMCENALQLSREQMDPIKHLQKACEFMLDEKTPIAVQYAEKIDNPERLLEILKKIHSPKNRIHFLKHIITSHEDHFISLLGNKEILQSICSLIPHYTHELFEVLFKYQRSKFELQFDGINIDKWCRTQACLFSVLASDQDLISHYNCLSEEKLPQPNMGAIKLKTYVTDAATIIRTLKELNMQNRMLLLKHLIKVDAPHFINIICQDFPAISILIYGDETRELVQILLFSEESLRSSVLLSLLQNSKTRPLLLQIDPTDFISIVNQPDFQKNCSIGTIQELSEIAKQHSNKEVQQALYLLLFKYQQANLETRFSISQSIDKWLFCERTLNVVEADSLPEAYGDLYHHLINHEWKEPDPSAIKAQINNTLTFVGILNKLNINNRFALLEHLFSIDKQYFVNLISNNPNAILNLLPEKNAKVILMKLYESYRDQFKHAIDHSQPIELKDSDEMTESKESILCRDKWFFCQAKLHELKNQKDESLLSENITDFKQLLHPEGKVQTVKIDFIDSLESLKRILESFPPSRRQFILERLERPRLHSIVFTLGYCKQIFDLVHNDHKIQFLKLMGQNFLTVTPPERLFDFFNDELPDKDRVAFIDLLGENYLKSLEFTHHHAAQLPPLTAAIDKWSHPSTALSDLIYKKCVQSILAEHKNDFKKAVNFADQFATSNRDFHIRLLAAFNQHHYGNRPKDIRKKYPFWRRFTPADKTNASQKLDRMLHGEVVNFTPMELKAASKDKLGLLGERAKRLGLLKM